jgi:hypothetical protein
MVKKAVINRVFHSATVKEFQSIDAFNSFYPMEVIATKAETDALISRNKTAPFLVFPEDRLNSIRMNKDLPQRWIQHGPQNKYTGVAARGENFAFQLGVYALQQLENVNVSFSNLISPTGKSIPASALFCINTGGTTYDAKPLTKIINVAQGDIQALWCGVDVPVSALPSTYTGKVTIRANGKVAKTIILSIKVNSKILKDGGVNEPFNMTRLGWLNSTMAQENTVIAPYTPLTVDGNTISLLGRKVEVNKDGFPKQVQTYFTPGMTEYATTPNNLLTEGIHFHFIDADKHKMTLKSQGLQFTKKESGTVQWTAISANDTLQMDVSASLEFDGFIAYTVKVEALQDVSLKEINMHIPLKKDYARYMIGLGQRGGYRPESLDWKWDVANKNQDGAWVGSVNGGLQYSLRDERYVRPLNTNFYLQKPLVLPSSWGNDNKGGIKIAFDGKAVLVNNYSGERNLKKGDELYYNFTLLVTPFHTIDTDFQWATRFYHAYKPIDTVKAAGATLINIHHATAINPTINYPFIAWHKMKAYDDSAHAAGLKVKIYNTIRSYLTMPMKLSRSEASGTKFIRPAKVVASAGYKNTWATIILRHGLYLKLKTRPLSTAA